jgi:hypothetical protein
MLRSLNQTVHIVKTMRLAVGEMGTGQTQVLWVRCSAPAVGGTDWLCESGPSVGICSVEPNPASTVACNSGTDELEPLSHTTCQQRRSHLAAAVDCSRQYPEVWHQFANRT